jgi:predicted transcriptional regulator
MTTLKVGIASYEEMKSRTMAVARGEHRVAADEPKVWFTSTESFAKVLSAGNRELLRVIAEKAPGSLDELARITGKPKSNLSRTLRTMEGSAWSASNAAGSRPRSCTTTWSWTCRSRSRARQADRVRSSVLYWRRGSPPNDR